MKFTLIRHASLWLEYAGSTLLVDPMLGAAGVNPPIANSGDDRRNPLVGLPGDPARWLSPDAVLVTHLHPDHWDDAAAEGLPKAVPVFCQPGDQAAFRGRGFGDVTEVDGGASFRGISIVRTGGRHGTGEIGRRMGPVSGFVLRAPGEPTVYVAGDTIWCDEVKDALESHRPDVVVVNAGGAEFLTGGPITMDAEGVIAVVRHAPDTEVIAVHMDAINHCRVTRGLLRERLAAEGLAERVAIPLDGDTR
ncbi:MBL fold metallo-hydrolase [Paenibacillus sp. MWE-103]|uniref:MBL fold metallo-hydrolase n=1 Tax=Paenibacillus artemisiicola TaxID=1172618 RepID=A0ABS3WJR6_9BACL|nr:MBL fold metallo-hydrolase [Paenibacillus artemisiicola]MBO7748565.1 MBL fold metallo-hydrolase [Paenibacillus artemisiicola]